MMDEMDHLLEDAEDLITCPADDEERSRRKHSADCPWCEWRQNYLRFKTDRENREAAETAARLA